jgi:hypothetical protein
LTPSQTNGSLEYRALRATIRERGTARLVLLPLAFAAWAGTAVAASVMTTVTVSLSTVLPLMVLAAGFEAVFALHVNVERIGRYVQAFHSGGRDRWEQVAMAFGRQFPASGPDPIFARLFILSTSVNFFPAALGGEPWEIVVIAVCHLAFVYRIRKAQAFAARQRTEDLARFESLRSTLDQPTATDPTS